MTLGYHFLFSNWIEKNGTEDNNNDLSDSGKPNLNSRFRGPTLGVHLNGIGKSNPLTECNLKSGGPTPSIDPCSSNSVIRWGN